MPGVQMRAASGADPARLTLMGDVGFDITAGGVSAALRDIADDAPITISLHSYGGDALAGVAIHNILARRKGRKRMLVEGVAASAASLIAMAGDDIVMPENAFLMIHEAWGIAVGDADSMRQNAEVLDMVSGAYRRTYAQRTGLTEEEVAALMAAETWMTAEDAVARGFATETAAPAEVRADAARLSRFGKVPSALRDRSTPPASPAHQKEGSMPDREIPAGGQPAPQAAASPPLPAPVAVAATLAELEGVASRASLGAEWTLAQLRAGATIAAATDAALEALATQARNAGQAAAVNAAAAAAPAPVQAVVVQRDEGDTIRARLSGAFAANIVATAQGIAPAYAEDQREFAGLGFHALARELMAARGARNVHRLDGAQLIEALLGGGTPMANSVHTTSDFAGVLANTLNKTVRELYAAYPNTWSAWCDEVEVADYKTITAASIGQASEVLAFAEGGPIVAGTIAEDVAETYQVSERGVILPVGKQALVNDDTRALSRAAQALALGAYTGLRRVVFGVLTGNANMADGIAFLVLQAGAGTRGFGNLMAASGLDAAAIRTLRELLQAMPGPMRAGRPSPSMPPVTRTVLLVPPRRETVAYELTQPLIVPAAAGSALPTEYRSSISVIMEPFLQTANNPFYMARTEPGMRPVEIAYIRGQRTPQITQAERIDYTGITFRCLFDFGAKSVTWRTIAGNLGT